MYMKKILRVIFLVSLFLPSTWLFSAESNARLTDEELDYAELVSTIQDAGSPYLKGDYAIFTSKSAARHIGIAFDFEGFKTIHSFKIKKIIDMEYNEAGSIYFYILKIPKNVLEINYRLIVDGLWTVDPLNDETVFSRETNLALSHLNASREIPKVTEKISGGKIRFIYRGKTGQKVRVGGSFTNWDSWIYQMSEVAPGIYQFEIPLPPGKYEYAFYTGINSFPDPGNPQKCYSPDGKTASMIVMD